MTQKFELAGFYKYINAPNGQGNLTGELEVAEDGSFESEIYDHASRAPKQFIKGHLLTEGGLDKLIFLKFPPKIDLANLAYDLQKKSKDSFEGKYSGKWGALPVKISYNKDHRLFLAQIDMNMCSVGDYAEITLNRK